MSLRHLNIVAGHAASLEFHHFLIIVATWAASWRLTAPWSGEWSYCIVNYLNYHLIYFLSAADPVHLSFHISSNTMCCIFHANAILTDVLLTLLFQIDFSVTHIDATVIDSKIEEWRAVNDCRISMNVEHLLVSKRRTTRGMNLSRWKGDSTVSWREKIIFG